MIRGPSKRMTIAQLKRHIDRKFATKKEVQRLREDLRRFATKNDLRRFATKNDFTTLEARMNLGFADVGRRLDSLDAKMESMFKQLAGAIAQRDPLFDEHEERIRDLEASTGS